MSVPDSRSVGPRALARWRAWWAIGALSALAVVGTVVVVVQGDGAADQAADTSGSSPDALMLTPGGCPVYDVSSGGISASQVDPTCVAGTMIAQACDISADALASYPEASVAQGTSRVDAFSVLDSASVPVGYVSMQRQGAKTTIVCGSLVLPVASCALDAFGQVVTAESESLWADPSRWASPTR